MSEDTGLSEREIEAIREVLRSFPKVQAAVLYGSRAMGNQRRGSDIDLTLQGERLSYGDLQAIELALDDLMLPYKMDVSLYHQIDNDRLLDHIRRVGLALYRRG